MLVNPCKNRLRYFVRIQIGLRFIVAHVTDMKRPQLPSVNEAVHAQRRSIHPGTAIESLDHGVSPGLAVIIQCSFKSLNHNQT